MAIILEIGAAIVTAILAVLWILIPNVNWEPWILLFGCAAGVCEILRRITAGKSKPKDDDPDPVEVVRVEMTKWCDQIRDVLRHIDAHVDSI